jgi:hypothetical protein
VNELFPNNHEYTSGRHINKDRSHIWLSAHSSKYCLGIVNEIIAKDSGVSHEQVSKVDCQSQNLQKRMNLKVSTITAPNYRVFMNILFRRSVLCYV